MCDYFAAADPMLYESRRRSVRIHGVSTSLRLENHVWDVLAGIAGDMGCSTNVLLGKLYDELIARHGDVTNFASFLRVTCLRHLARPASAEAVAADAATAKSNLPTASTRH